MADPDPKQERSKDEKPKVEKPVPRWVKPLAAGLGLLLVAGLIGFGIGYLTRSGDSGPDLTREEAFAQASEQTRKEVSREMARLGFIDGKRSGRSHGIIAGGMAAESAVTIEFREQRAAAAQNQAAEAQAELAGISGSPPPIPDFSSGD